MDSGVKGFAASNVKKRYMFTAMELLLGVVFLGWLFMWVMMPTKTYKQTWMVKLRADTNSTYIGPLGANLLTFTFPILFIAVLGCVYLHLRKKFDNYTESNSKAGHLDLWRRPVLVKGPLGIVSGLELAFFSMFIALLIWAISSFLYISFSSINSKTVKDGEHLWAARLDAAGLRLGLVGNIVCAFLFFPVARGSSILPLVGLTSESSIKYHIWLGHIVMALFTAHGLCYIIFWASTNQISQMLAWDKIEVANVPGELALICGLLMWVTSIPRFRRKMFELFYYTHHLYFLFLFFFVLHIGIAFFCYILPGVYLFLVDRCLRFLQSRCKVRLVSARVLPCEAVELNFSKNPGLTFTSPSMVFINVPSISSLQWHPFTVTSNSNMEPDKLSVVIKKEGSWSEKLYQVLISSPSSIDRLEVSLEGPYGPTSTHLLRHDTLVMVSGGSGITPFISIIRELIYRSTSPSSPLPRILLITVFKNSSDLTMLDLLLPLTGIPSDISRLQFQLEAFVTRDQQPTTLHAQNLLRTIWFKPNATDAPVSAVLGPNNWLWLGAIISTSFVGFLLLLGILTRYYIYPIDHNTNIVFPYSGRSAFSILFVCVCIAATASAVVMWNKKQNAMEGKKIEHVEGQSPTTSPGSWFYNADRELESLPHQSLVQATKVHFGARPNLKKMLLECEGSSVGVMVCGPRGMRHEVANVCSSGLANHLHFESISFGW